MSEQCDPRIYWPNNVRRVEARILVPVDVDEDGWAIAKALTEAIGKHGVLLVGGPRGFWYVADLVEADGDSPPVSKRPLRLVDGLTR
jgi:hypothetical protein